MPFAKSDPTPFGMPKQVFLAHFEHVPTRFGPRKIPECLANGPFWYQQWVKNGSKTRVSKSDHGTFTCSNKCFSPILSHWLQVLAHGKCQNGLQMGPFGTKKFGQNGSRTCFSKSNHRPFGMLKQVFLAHFERVIDVFWPMEKAKMPCKCSVLGPKIRSKMGQERLFSKAIIHHLGCSNKCL